MQYQWEFGPVFEQFSVLMSGFTLTVYTAFVGFVLSALFALLVVLMRISSNRLLSGIALAYTAFFRGTPFLVQLLWLYYSIPTMTGIVLDSITTAIVGITLNLGAFIAETYRAGITSIDRGQREASLALGMTPAQVMRRIILPQALMRVMPPLANYWVTIFKDTSLFSLIAVFELTYQARFVAVETFRPLETYTLLAVIYFAITYPQARIVDWIYDRFRVKE